MENNAPILRVGLFSGEDVFRSGFAVVICPPNRTPAPPEGYPNRRGPSFCGRVGRETLDHFHSEYSALFFQGMTALA